MDPMEVEMAKRHLLAVAAFGAAVLTAGAASACPFHDAQASNDPVVVASSDNAAPPDGATQAAPPAKSTPPASN